MALTEPTHAMTIGSALTSRATSDPERPYLLFRDEVVTFGGVEADAESLAAALANLGVEAGDRIALLLPPRPEFAVALFAAAKLGAVIVPLNPRLTTTELHYMLRHSEAVCAITAERAFGLDYLELFEELMPQLPELQYLVTVGDEDLWYDDRIFQFEDLLSAGSGRDYAGTGVTDETDVFALVYTSGTIGKPKGVELSHRNLLYSARGTSGAIGLLAEDRVVGVSALFHVFGLGPGLLSTLLAGASLVLEEEPDSGSTLDEVEARRATVLYGIPTGFYKGLVEQRERARDLSSLRLTLVAGAPAGDELVQAMVEEWSVAVLNAYTVTEVASTVSMSRFDDPEDKRRFTVGRPLPGTDVRILEDDGTELPVESVGEIGIRGPGVMVGYYRQPRGTAGAFDNDGYFTSGDLGLIDHEGFLHLVGRRKDVIIRSGFNVYPREVEARLESHPAVQEVAAVGIADPILGEAICACVVPVEGAIVTDDEMLDWCRETLADVKVPDLVRFFDDLPHTDTGKVRRVELTRLISAGQST